MPTQLATSDVELISASREGDTAAFGQLVTRYQSLACSVAYNRCGDLAASEDFAQEAFLQAWKSLSSLRDASSFKSWLCTIVRNLATRAGTRKTAQSPSHTSSLDVAIEPSDESADPAQNLLSAEQGQLVWQALEEIPENYREPLILFYREEKSVIRVAEALGISQDATKQRLARGRKMLHEHMVATVENVLETTKPSPQFAGAVMTSLTGMGKMATTSGGTIATATASASSAGLFWLPLAQLPFLVWLFRVAVDETRSVREREMVVRHQVLSLLSLIPMFALMIGSIYLPKWTDNPVLQGLTIPGISVLYYIPMIWSIRRLGRRIEELREEEKTATPPRDSALNAESVAAPLKQFIGSAWIVAICPALWFCAAQQWGMALACMAIASVGGAIGFALRGTDPTRAMRVYGVSLGVVTLSMIWLMWISVSSPGHSLFWFAACLQASAVSLAILQTIAWRRVHGK